MLRKLLFTIALALVALACGPIRAQSGLSFRPNLKAVEEVNDGMRAFKDAQYPQAVELFKTALELDPNFTTARLYLALAYMQQYIPGAEAPENLQMARAAEQELQKVLDQSPDNESALASIASLLFNEKRLDEAQQWYEKLVSMSPANKEGYYTLGVIAWTKAFKARMEARAEAGMQPQDPGPLKDAKIHAELVGRYGPIIDEGIRNLDRALQLDSEYDDAMAYENLLYREKADLENSMETYELDMEIAENWVQRALETRRDKALRRPPAFPMPVRPRNCCPQAIRR